MRTPLAVSVGLGNFRLIIQSNDVRGPSQWSSWCETWWAEISCGGLPSLWLDLTTHQRSSAQGALAAQLLGPF